MAKKGTSPWLYIGCGCVALIGLAIAAVVAAGFMGASFFQGYVEDMQDPQARAEKVKQILGTEALPEGYHARMYFSVPWVLDMVFLSDGQPTEEGVFDENFQPFDSAGLGEHVFVFFSVRGDAGDGDLEEIFESRGRSGEVQFDMGSHFRSLEELSRGEIEIEPQKLSYITHRGELETEDRERIVGIYAQMRANCPKRDRTRLAVWFERLPTSDGESESTAEATMAASDAASENVPLDLPGTPADESTLRDFMSHFNLCAK